MPFLTLRDNIALGKKNLPEEKLSQLIKLVHLQEAASRYPHELSGGMQQRASLARTLAQDNDFILMDEPFAALDYFTRGHIQKELLAMRKKRPFGVLLVTHNVDEALRLGDRILILQGGQIHPMKKCFFKRPLRGTFFQHLISQSRGRFLKPLKYNYLGSTFLLLLQERKVNDQ